MKSIVTCLLIAGVLYGYPQTPILKKSTIGATGGTYLINKNGPKIAISHTVGQTSLIDGNKAGTMIVLQGFQHHLHRSSNPKLSKLHVEMYPNPSTGKVTVAHEKLNQGFTIKVYDSKGMLIKRIEHGNGGNSRQVKLTGLSRGLYHLQFNLSNGQVATQRLIIR